uniref:Uncharacterized protein n=1 Tax=Oryza meridionalis TaxID=40149 RepID=A0A0E0DEZ2_9ORYZ
MGRSRPSPPPPHASEARDIDSKSIGPSSNGSDEEKVNSKALKDVIYKECFIHSGLKILSILSDVRLHPHDRWNICQKVGSRAAILQNLVNPIEVFVDDECAGKPAPQVPKSSKPSIMKLRQAASRNLKREIELLMENPQRNFPLTNFCLDHSKLIKSSTMVSPVIYAQRRLSYLMNGMGRQQALGDAMQAWRRPTTFNFLDAALPSLGMEIESEEAIEEKGDVLQRSPLRKKEIALRVPIALFITITYAPSKRTQQRLFVFRQRSSKEFPFMDCTRSQVATLI